MRVLRLGTSADTHEGIVEGERTPALTRAMFEQGTGEPLEISMRVLHPTNASAAILDAWLDEVRPDAVFIWVNPFWFAYESAPLRLRRSGGVVGRLAGRAARRATESPRVARSPVFQLARRIAQKTVGASYYYEPGEVVAAMETWLHLILRRETVVPLVYLPVCCMMYEPDEGRLARAEARRVEVNGLVAALCRRLHVICVEPDVSDEPPTGRDCVGPDMMHPTAPVHRWFAERQLPAHIAAWRELRGESSSVERGLHV